MKQYTGGLIRLLELPVVPSVNRAQRRVRVIKNLLRVPGRFRYRDPDGLHGYISGAQHGCVEGGFSGTDGPSQNIRLDLRPECAAVTSAGSQNNVRLLLIRWKLLQNCAQGVGGPLQNGAQQVFLPGGAGKTQTHAPQAAVPKGGHVRR